MSAAITFLFLAGHGTPGGRGAGRFCPAFGRSILSAADAAISALRPSAQGFLPKDDLPGGFGLPVFRGGLH